MLPAAIVTLAGVAAAVLLLDSVTTAPPDGAALVSVAVPCELLPPTTVDGLSEIAESEGGDGADCGVKLRTADHAPAVPAEFTPRARHQCWTPASVLAVNCDIVTVWSTTSGVENVLESSIWMRYEVAVLTSVQSSVTGRAIVAPLAGLTSVGADGVGSVTVSVAVRFAPNEPDIVTDVDDATVWVVTVNVRLVLPAATVTLEGTVATAVLLLDSVTTAPPLGAAALRVTVPVEELPPTTVVGLTFTEESVGVGAGGVTPSAAKRIESTSRAES